MHVAAGHHVRLAPGGRRSGKGAPRIAPRRSTTNHDASTRVVSTLRALAPPPSQTSDAADTTTTTPAPPFSWRKHFYPVAVIADLPVDEPTKVTLLGDDLVIWLSTNATWAAAADACPHRLAPLSQGRVEGGVLACSYHGWEFEGGGACTRFPQPCSGRGVSGAATAAASPRACLRTRPVKVAQGLLWVWGDDGETAAVDAAAASPTLIPGVDASDPTLASDGSGSLLYMGQVSVCVCVCVCVCV